MTYDEIFSEVRSLSKRGDIDDKIRAGIRTITLYAHRLDYFWRDRIEAQLAWSAASALVDLNVITFLPRFRAAEYVRYWEPATNRLGNMLTKIEPRDVMNTYNYEKLDRWYMAGDIMKLKFAFPSTGIQVGYFCSPIVWPTASYSSWIADQFPDLIIQGALAAVFNQTGQNEEARQINKFVGIIDGYDPRNGPTLVQQLKAYALEEDAR